MREYFTCTCVCALHVCPVPTGCQRRVTNLLRTELQMVVSHDVSPENQTEVLYQSSKSSEPLSLLSNLDAIIEVKRLMTLLTKNNMCMYVYLWCHLCIYMFNMHGGFSVTSGNGEATSRGQHVPLYREAVTSYQ